MTREEMEMRKLVRESDVIDKTNGTELAKAFNYLWKKYIEQEPCEDAISRQAVLNLPKRTMKNYFGEVVGEVVYVKDIMELPSVTPKSETVTEFADRCRECGARYGKLLKLKTGHWSRKTKVDAYDIAGVKTWGIKCQCDRCDFTTIVVEDFGYYKYCPNCGAKMESEE